MNPDGQIKVKPVEVRAFSLDEASDILEKQDPTKLPQWQIHGEPVVVADRIKIVMLKLDRIAPPTIVTPPAGPILVPR